MSRGAGAPMRACARFAPFAFFSLLAVVNAASVSVQFNTARTYGFDGPWQAVTVNVGGFENGLTASSQWTTVDLLPGGFFDSFIPSPTICKHNSSGFCGAGGVWDPSETNQTQDGQPIDYEPSTSNSGGNGIFQQGIVYAQNLVLPSSACSGGNNCIIPNASLVSLQEANVTLPNGQTTQLEIGSLALGASSQTQDFTTGSNIQGEDAVETWNAPGYLFNTSVLQSDTYSLHIGAAQLGFPGSLVYGGFDQGRAIGPATAWSANSNPQLLDIVIDVETGGSPFNFTSTQTGLLLTNTSQHESLPVAPLPAAAYLGLPKQTCDNLARYLPVQFDSGSQYYLWNTEDPNYTKIVSSAAYLGFSFAPAAGGTDNVVIKVPFMLLNLSLTEVASGRPGITPYFPCVPYTPQGGSNVYTLGRAFLQSALLAGNFASGISWLAQAPGPGATKNGLGSGPQVVDIAPDDSSLSFVANASGSAFNSSWTGYWTPLEGSFTSSNNSTNITSAPDGTISKTSSGGGGGLSSGAAAGIGAGVAIAGVAVIAAIGVLFWRRRRRSQAQSAAEGQPFVPGGQQPPQQPQPQMQQQQQQQEGNGFLPATGFAASSISEMGGEQRYQDHPYKGAFAPTGGEHSNTQYGGSGPVAEMPSNGFEHYELPANGLVEMDGNGARGPASAVEAPTVRSPT